MRFMNNQPEWWEQETFGSIHFVARRTNITTDFLLDGEEVADFCHKAEILNNIRWNFQLQVKASHSVQLLGNYSRYLTDSKPKSGYSAFVLVCFNYVDKIWCQIPHLHSMCQYLYKVIELEFLLSFKAIIPRRTFLLLNYEA